MHPREVCWDHFFIIDLPNHISQYTINLHADDTGIICAEEVQISLQYWAHE